MPTFALVVPHIFTFVSSSFFFFSPPPMWPFLFEKLVGHMSIFHRLPPPWALLYIDVYNIHVSIIYRWDSIMYTCLYCIHVRLYRVYMSLMYIDKTLSCTHVPVSIKCACIQIKVSWRSMESKRETMVHMAFGMQRCACWYCCNNMIWKV